MAKVRTSLRENLVSRKLEIKKVKPRFTNKIAEARKLSEHQAARTARRWGAPAGVALVVFLLISSFLIPKDSFQEAKEKLLRNPNDFQYQIALSEEFLKNNQLEEAERALLLAQRNKQLTMNNKQFTGGVLGEEDNSKLAELWQKKYYSDPKDIKQLIVAWEKIIEEKTSYRDGYLQLAYLHYKLYENEKAKEYLEKALELDPNYEPTKELERIIGN